MGELLKRYGAYVALIVLVGIVGLVLWARFPRPAPIIISTPVPTVAPTTTATPIPAPLRVYVTGAVHKPDVYVLAPNSIVKDAIAAAGGATADADLDRINLAVQVSDQQHIYVPRKGEESPPIAPPTAALSSTVPSASAGKVNINAASVEELDTLPGIGPAIAQRIVDYRTENGPFATIEDLMQVKGIGPSTFDELKARITVE